MPSFLLIYLYLSFERRLFNFRPPGTGKTSIANALVNDLGVRYRFLKADNNLRGYRFDKVFIQGNVSQDYIDDYIKPTMCQQSNIVVIVG